MLQKLMNLVSQTWTLYFVLHMQYSNKTFDVDLFHFGSVSGTVLPET